VSTDRTTVVVGRVGRPHGVQGDVSVEVRTDEPERRFTEGSVLLTDRASVGDVTVERARWHSGRLLLHLIGFDDRSAAESLRGMLLSVDVDPSDLPDDPDEYYDHQLVGLAVVDVSGVAIGEITQVSHGAQDLLVVHRVDGGEAMVPFVRELVPEVDLAHGRVVTDLPEGLLDLGSDGSGTDGG
jgi:16S rRNA processing protein RimM